MDYIIKAAKYLYNIEDKGYIAPPPQSKELKYPKPHAKNRDYKLLRTLGSLKPMQGIELHPTYKDQIDRIRICHNHIHHMLTLCRDYKAQCRKRKLPYQFDFTVSRNDKQDKIVVVWRTE